MSDYLESGENRDPLRMQESVKSYRGQAKSLRNFVARTETVR